MGQLREKMIRDMRLRRLAESTQRTYEGAVVGLAKHYMKSPDQFTEKQVQDYILCMLYERRVAVAWMRLSRCCAGPGMS